MKILDNLGGYTMFAAVIANIDTWFLDGSVNVILTLLLTAISIPYMVFKLINEIKRYKREKGAK